MQFIIKVAPISIAATFSVLLIYTVATQGPALLRAAKASDVYPHHPLLHVYPACSRHLLDARTSALDDPLSSQRIDIYMDTLMSHPRGASLVIVETWLNKRDIPPAESELALCIQKETELASAGKSREANALAATHPRR